MSSVQQPKQSIQWLKRCARCYNPLTIREIGTRSPDEFGHPICGLCFLPWYHDLKHVDINRVFNGDDVLTLPIGWHTNGEVPIRYRLNKYSDTTYGDTVYTVEATVNDNGYVISGFGRDGREAFASLAETLIIDKSEFVIPFIKEQDALVLWLNKCVECDLVDKTKFEIQLRRALVSGALNKNISDAEEKLIQLYSLNRKKILESR